MARLNDLKQMGASDAVDDFGPGCSSLQRVARPNQTALLCVPSAIVAQECNDLIDPSQPVEYIIDGRQVDV